MSILGSVPVSGFVAPTAETDIYPSHDSKYGKGGWREVATLLDRDAITVERRAEGMAVYVQETDTVYILKDGIDNTNWTLLQTGGGTSTISGATDVVLTALADGEVLKWDAATGKWVNGTAGGTGGTGTWDIYDEGVLVSSGITKVNLVGADVNCFEGSPGEVTIYIPSASFSSHFNTTDGITNAVPSNVATTNRYVAAPTSEGTPYKIGDWTAGNLYPTTRAATLAYSTPEKFSIANNTSTTITVKVYGADSITVLDTVTGTIVGDGTFTSTSTFVTATISGFVTETIRYAASLAVNINIAGILPNSGRFSVEIIHNDAGTSYSFGQNNIFYDTEPSIASLTSVTIAPTVGGEVIGKVSGVPYYSTGTQFTVTAAGIDNINADTYPSTVLDITGAGIGLPALAITTSGLTGWTNVHSNTGASYQKTDWAINAGSYCTSSAQTAQAKVNDWTAGTLVNSNSLNYRIQTYADNSTRVYEDFRGETNRLTSVYGAWDNNQVITSYDGTNGLIVECSRLVYPTKNYTTYNPAGPNYSGLTGNRVYYRRFWHTGTSHSNGILHMGDTNIVETDIVNSAVKIDISLDGVQWYSCNVDYLGGALSNGSGCRINADTRKNGYIEFTLGTGKFTDAASSWGILVRITYTTTNKYLGIFEITNWS